MGDFGVCRSGKCICEENYYKPQYENTCVKSKSKYFFILTRLQMNKWGLTFFRIKWTMWKRWWMCTTNRGR